MPEYTAAFAKPESRLSDAYGREIILTEDGAEGSTVYRIVLEFSVHGVSYAALRAEEAGPDGELSVFRITRLDDGEPGIETIEDDEEWESVSELADELLESSWNGEPL